MVVSAYAIDHALEELGWAREDILAQIGDLRRGDFLRKELSDRDDGVVIWVFRPASRISRCGSGSVRMEDSSSSASMRPKP